MKKNLLILLLISTFNIIAQTPRSGGINNIQATVLNIVHDNFVGVQTANLNAFAVYNFSTNFDYYLGLKTTDNIPEGVTNKYFSNTLARNAFSAGFGLNYSSGIYSLDSTTQSILSSVSGKALNSTTITINGITYDLNSNRTYNVGDLFSSASYSNPSWLTSLAYSKLTGTPLLSIVATSGSYNDLTNKPSIPNYSAGTGINIVGSIITNSAPDQTVSLTGGNRIAISGTYPNFTISYIEPTINIVSSKTLNSNFTVSTSKQATVSYSLTCSVTNPLLAGSSTANVYLEYSTNAGSSWNLPSQNGNASTVGVAVAIAITNGQTVTVTGVIPANALVRLRTATTGTASVTYITGIEIY